ELRSTVKQFIQTRRREERIWMHRLAARQTLLTFLPLAIEFTAKLFALSLLRVPVIVILEGGEGKVLIQVASIQMPEVDGQPRLSLVSHPLTAWTILIDDH